MFLNTTIYRHGVDFTDTILFPLAEKRWKSFADRLGQEGLAQVIHKEEIPSETMESLYTLFNDTVAALNARGSPGYQDALAKIPPAYHHRLHFILQYSAQVKDNRRKKAFVIQFQQFAVYPDYV